jgi:O-acetyl-ADP-ribose deacetylase
LENTTLKKEDFGPGSPVFKNIFVVNGDITKAPVDAICNAADECGLGGSGVDDAIHAAVGEEWELADYIDKVLPERSKEDTKSFQKGTNIRCPTGTALPVLVPSFKGRSLHPAIKIILQAVGPTNDLSAEVRKDLICALYTEILDKCEEYKIRHVVIPAISTGAYKGPDSILIPRHVLETVRKWFVEHIDSKLKVIFIFLSTGEANIQQRDIYVGILKKYFTDSLPFHEIPTPAL